MVKKYEKKREIESARAKNREKKKVSKQNGERMIERDLTEWSNKERGFN